MHQITQSRVHDSDLQSTKYNSSTCHQRHKSPQVDKLGSPMLGKQMTADCPTFLKLPVPAFTGLIYISETTIMPLLAHGSKGEANVVVRTYVLQHGLTNFLSGLLGW